MPCFTICCSPYNRYIVAALALSKEINEWSSEEEEALDEDYCRQVNDSPVVSLFTTFPYKASRI